MVKLRHPETGETVHCSHATAERLRAEWEPKPEPKPEPRAKRQSAKSGD